MAYAYAMNFGGQYLMNLHQQLLKDLDKNEFGKLDIMHHLSAGMKATYSRICYDGLDTVRQSCGGAGFSSFSGLPSLQVDYAPNTTFEGDNTVMLQQTAKLMFKTMKQLLKGHKALGFFSYFNEIDDLLKQKSTVKTADDLLNLDQLENALAVRTAFKVKYTFSKLGSSKASEVENVNSLYAVDIVSMAHSHMMYVTFKIFREYIDKTQFKC